MYYILKSGRKNWDGAAFWAGPAKIYFNLEDALTAVRSIGEVTTSIQIIPLTEVMERKLIAGGRARI